MSTKTDIAEIGERLKQAFSDAYNAIPNGHPELKKWCYLSVANHEPTPIFRLAGLGSFELSDTSLPGILSQLGEYDPVAHQMAKVKKAEAELKALKDELTAMKGGAQ